MPPLGATKCTARSADLSMCVWALLANPSCFVNIANSYYSTYFFYIFCICCLMQVLKIYSRSISYMYVSDCKEYMTVLQNIMTVSYMQLCVYWTLNEHVSASLTPVFYSIKPLLPAINTMAHNTSNTSVKYCYESSSLIKGWAHACAGLTSGTSSSADARISVLSTLRIKIQGHSCALLARLRWLLRAVATLYY